MRAGRLLNLLITLQSRGRSTAQELADELDVSVRTIYRDMDALVASGVPVAADRGPSGGYSLVAGYGTRLTSMTADEAAELTRAGAPPAAAELGLGRALAGARGSVPAAAPAELAERAGRIAQRFHLDAPGWFREVDHVPTLTGIADAVWNQRVVRLRYRTAGDESPPIDVEPLGVVLKAGRWYMVATPHGPGEPSGPRTLRVTRILDLETRDARFERPPGFDLWRYWTRRDETTAHYQAEATVRISPTGLAGAEGVLRPHTVRALTSREWPVDAEGWTVAVVPVESLAEARAELLGLGPEVEVLSPVALREQMSEVARGLAGLYGRSTAPGPAPAPTGPDGRAAAPAPAAPAPAAPAPAGPAPTPRVRVPSPHPRTSPGGR